MKYFAAILALCALCSCQAFHIDEILDRAERQLTDAPDSALVTMQSIRRYALLRPTVRARYGVVYSAALDKNYVDVTADSLIRYSASYYDLHGTAEERMRAYYYLGRVYENAKDYQQALLYYLDAAQYTESVEDNYLKGLLYSNLGEMYQQYYNYDKAYKYAEQSYHFYKEAKLLKHQVYQLYKAGELLGCMERYSESIETLRRTIYLADSCNYTQINFLCYKSLLQAYEKSNNFIVGYNLLIKMENEFSDNAIYKFLSICGTGAHLYAQVGNKKRAENLLEQGWKLAKNRVDSVYMRYYHTRYLQANRKYIESYKMYSKALFSHNAILFDNINNPVSAAEGKYFKQKAIQSELRAKQQRGRYILIFVLCVLFIVAISLYVYIKKRREIAHKNELIKQYLSSVQSLHSELAERDEKLKEVSSEIFGEAFKAIDELCCTYFEYSDNPKQQSAILNHVKRLIGNISSKPYLVQLEEQINGCYDNILEKLKSEFPTLSENEYMLSCYLCAGFTTQAICLFLNCNSSAVYNRISRLRKKIKDSTSENKELFLIYL